MVFHCGGCMLNDRELKSRIRVCETQNTPISNYGLSIAYMNGILRRSLEIFPDLAAILDNKNA